MSLYYANVNNDDEELVSLAILKQKIRQKNSWVDAGSGSLPSE